MVNVTHSKKYSYIPTSELSIKKLIVFGNFYALRIYISVNFNNPIAMSKTLTGKLQNKNTQEISYMNNYIVYEQLQCVLFSSSSSATSIPLGNIIGFNVFAQMSLSQLKWKI